LADYEFWRKEDAKTRRRKLGGRTFDLDVRPVPGRPRISLNYEPDALRRIAAKTQE
jgi:hypothetical protein